MTDLNLEGLTEAQLSDERVRRLRRVQRLMTEPISLAVLGADRRRGWSLVSESMGEQVKEGGRAAEQAAQQKILAEIREEHKP